MKILSSNRVQVPSKKDLLMCRQSKIIIPSFHSLFSSPGRKTQSAFLIKLFVVYIKLPASWLSNTFYIFTIIIFAGATVPISTKLLTNYPHRSNKSGFIEF